MTTNRFVKLPKELKDRLQHLSIGLREAMRRRGLTALYESKYEPQKESFITTRVRLSKHDVAQLTALASIPGMTFSRAVVLSLHFVEYSCLTEFFRGHDDDEDEGISLLAPTPLPSHEEDREELRCA